MADRSNPTINLMTCCGVALLASKQWRLQVRFKSSGKGPRMKTSWRGKFVCGAIWLLAVTAGTLWGDEPTDLPKALIDGRGPGWKELGEADFVNVNCAADTWSWKEGVTYCTGQPVGVLRSQKPYTNFELVAQWRHMRSGGNSGIFVWTTEDSLNKLKGSGLPHGIEVQVLDHGYAEQYEKKTGKKPDWFTTNGDDIF